MDTLPKSHPNNDLDLVLSVEEPILQMVEEEISYPGKDSFKLRVEALRVKRQRVHLVLGESASGKSLLLTYLNEKLVQSEKKNVTAFTSFHWLMEGSIKDNIILDCPFDL